jgi:hypothetical protein
MAGPDETLSSLMKEAYSDDDGYSHDFDDKSSHSSNNKLNNEDESGVIITNSMISDKEDYDDYDGYDDDFEEKTPGKNKSMVGYDDDFDDDDNDDNYEVKTPQQTKPVVVDNITSPVIQKTNDSVIKPPDPYEDDFSEEEKKVDALEKSPEKSLDKSLDKSLTNFDQADESIAQEEDIAPDNENYDYEDDYTEKDHSVAKQIIVVNSAKPHLESQISSLSFLDVDKIDDFIEARRATLSIDAINKAKEANFDDGIFEESGGVGAGGGGENKLVKQSTEDLIQLSDQLLKDEPESVVEAEVTAPVVTTEQVLGEPKIPESTAKPDATATALMFVDDEVTAAAAVTTEYMTEQVVKDEPKTPIDTAEPATAAAPTYDAEVTAAAVTTESSTASSPIVMRKKSAPHDSNKAQAKVEKMAWSANGVRVVSRIQRALAIANAQSVAMENKANKINSLFSRLEAALNFEESSADRQAAQQYWRLNGLYGATDDKRVEATTKRPRSAKARKKLQIKNDLKRSKPVMREGNPDYNPPSNFAKSLRGTGAVPVGGARKAAGSPLKGAAGDKKKLMRPTSAPAGRRPLSASAKRGGGRVRPGTAKESRRRKENKALGVAGDILLT